MIDPFAAKWPTVLHIGDIDSQLMDLRQVLLGSNTCAPS